MGYSICIEGSHKNRERKDALVSPARIHVDEKDVCDIPIGKDDTKEPAGWVLYREWLYRRKIGRNSGRKLQKLE